jgi:hypothetical protein
MTARHTELCENNAYCCAVENGAQDGEQAHEWAAAYLTDGIVECRCQDYVR